MPHPRCLLLLAALALTPAAAAQGWVETAQVVKPLPSFGDRFGTSAALCADTLLVGAPDDDHAAGVDAGSALVFERDLGGAGAWGERAVLLDPAAQASSGFGTSLALRGDVLVVGAPRADGLAAASGAAHVFERAGGRWAHVATLVAGDGATGDQLGQAVALAGERVFVGAPGDDAHGLDCGAAYVFARGPDGSWSQAAKLAAPRPRRLDRFGFALAAEDGLLAVGAPQPYDNQAGRVGAVHLFGLARGALEPLARLTAAGGGSFDGFGHSVAVHSGRVLVGAWLADGLAPGLADGAAYVFARDPHARGLWSEALLAPAEAENGDGLGWSVALFGDTAVAGAPYDGGVGAEIGSAWVFESR